MELGQKAQRMLQALIDDEWIDESQSESVIARAGELAVSHNAERIMPIDLCTATNEEIARQANRKRTID